MTNIRTAAKIVRPLPRPGARFELEITEPLGLQTWSVNKTNVTNQQDSKVHIQLKV